MITRVQVEGFKSFRKLDFEMKPLNVLIGPNGCGKTNFLDFFKFLREAADENVAEPYFKRGGAAGAVFRGQTDDSLIRVALEFDPLWRREFPEIKGTYSLLLGAHPTDIRVSEEGFTGTSGADEKFKPKMRVERPRGIEGHSLEISARHPRLATRQISSSGRDAFGWIGETVRNWASYDPIDTSEKAPVRSPVLARSGMKLSADGSNLTTVLLNLQSLPEGEDSYRRIEEILHMVFPGFKKLTFPPQGGDGRLLVNWREEPFDKGDFPATFLSDGTLKFLCLLTIFLCPTPPPLIMIEEPELGLHPDMIHYVAALAQQTSDRTQVIMTTHSPELVSALDPDDVVVFDKINGTTEMRRLSERHDMKAWLKDFQLGELWQMGEIGGRS